MCPSPPAFCCTTSTTTTPSRRGVELVLDPREVRFQQLWPCLPHGGHEQFAQFLYADRGQLLSVHWYPPGGGSRRSRLRCLRGYRFVCPILISQMWAAPPVPADSHVSQSGPRTATRVRAAYLRDRGSRPGFAERLSVYLLGERIIVWGFGQRYPELEWWDRRLTYRAWAEPFLNAIPTLL